MENQTTKRASLTNRLSSRTIFWGLYILTVIVVIIKGPDLSVPLWDIGNDDAMRLVQVRDFLAGQSWFDVTQYRLGLDVGTPMHWSRLIDLPIAAMIWTFSLVLTQDWAEMATMTLWPLILIAPTLWAMQRASVHFGGTQAGPFGYIFAIIAIFTTRKFEIGALDHHNVQMMLMAFILMSMMSTDSRGRDGLIVGISSALSIAIGLEMLIFVATITLMIGVNWVWNGKEAKSKSVLFAASFSLTMVVVYLLTKPDFGETIFRCDAYGMELLTIGLSGGIGLMGIAILFSAKTRLIRLACVLLLGVAVVLIAKIFAPQCLANPYDPLYPEVAREWLGRISESRSLFHIISLGNLTNFGFVVIPLIAALYSIYIIREPLYRMRAIILLLILVGAYVMMFYQIRGLFFLLQLCAIPLAAMVAQAYGNYKKTRAPLAGVLFIILLFVSIPNTWIVGAVSFGKPVPQPENVSRPGNFKDCKKPEEYRVFSNLLAGTVAASTDLGVMVLLNSPHRAISANFHRNQDGILANIGLMKADLTDAENLLEQWNVSYVVLCKNDFATQAFADLYPDGLWYYLYRGDVPGFLALVPDSEERLLYVYKTQF